MEKMNVSEEKDYKKSYENLIMAISKIESLEELEKFKTLICNPNLTKSSNDSLDNSDVITR